jgi:hypothetical protein
MTMGILGRLFGRRVERESGVLATEGPEASETPRIAPPAPTRGTRVLTRPEETPTTRPIGNFGTTAGTRSYRSPGGTPSTQRLHNPSRPGR